MLRIIKKQQFFYSKSMPLLKDDNKNGFGIILTGM